MRATRLHFPGVFFVATTWQYIMYAYTAFMGDQHHVCALLVGKHNA